MTLHVILDLGIDECIDAQVISQDHANALLKDGAIYPCAGCDYGEEPHNDPSAQIYHLQDMHNWGAVDALKLCPACKTDSQHKDFH